MFLSNYIFKIIKLIKNIKCFVSKDKNIDFIDVLVIWFYRYIKKNINEYFDT